ncbi:conserved hypothetical protein (plasmid) [Aster yellows witches'-broom phytoplasma AYWB]|uniref:DUF2963 domain-containing protein n=1 Tax=Aster yellows witches'-broom phytoplasma (strain AYWB) TaxID=322098 RepID=Q2NIF2_AYWBP|nr:DUF2963 domain-containing protein [Aster yellows witches'-broom phytoplasma]ABC65791.1 conserved hypothetical protein [Aster yellows witches'-broom phytoplasma AYWB]
MKNNNHKNPKNKIFIIWGLFISGVILVFLILLLLAINKPQPKTDTQNPQHLNSKINNQQEQQTYNAIIKKIEKEVDKLTQQQEQTPSLKYPPTINYYGGNEKKIHDIEEYDQDTGKKIKETYYDFNGIVGYIAKYSKDTGDIIQKTFYNPDGTEKKVKHFN